MTNYEAVIGIECHVQLKTKSKLFCACNNDAREAAPNTTVCPVCMGFPGTLPVLNEQAVKLALRAGLALNGQLGGQTKFDRKNYFYPDLPKGYQITQYDQPIVGAGYVYVPLSSSTGRSQSDVPDRGSDSPVKPENDGLRVHITRAHMEEDAGKLIHPAGSSYSLVDLNRAGTPLLEIVSEPDMRTPAQAKAYAVELYHLMRYADVSEVDLYYGNMRFDVNISVRPAGSTELGTRAEVKNLNSFRAVEKAAEYEFNRQVKLLESGGKVVQETRGWNDDKQITFSQRSKEEAHDYRYFPEPDLPPLGITQKLIAEVKAELPELPPQIRAKLTKAGVQASEIETLIGSPDLLALYESAKQHELAPKEQRAVVNWLVGPIQSEIGESGYDRDSLDLDGRMLAAFAKAVSDGKVSQTAAKDGILHLINLKSYGVAEIKKAIDARKQVSDSGELMAIVQNVINDNPKAAEDYRAGQTAAMGFLVGQVMKASQGQANPAMVNDILKKELGG